MKSKERDSGAKDWGSEVSKQISVYKTQNALLELNNCMRPASPLVPWHIHAEGREDEEGYSLIRAVMVDYSNRKDTISVYANLSPELVKYLYTQIASGVPNFSYSQQKIFHEEGAGPKDGIVTWFSINRSVRDAQGNERRMPWTIRIQNGYGRIAHNKNGGQFCEKGSYQAEKDVCLSLRDEDIFALFARAEAVIRGFEQDSMFRKRNAGNFQKLYKMLEKLILEKWAEMPQDRAA